MRVVAGGLAVATVLVAAIVAQAPAASNQVVSSSTGSGHMVRPDGTFRSFSFTARKYADGTSKGELQLNSRGFDVVVHQDRLPASHREHRAYERPHHPRVNNPDEGEIGELNRVEARDNGEGGKTPPDQVSTIPANPGDADPTTCVDPPTNATIRTVHRGNVQVRG